MTKVTNDNLRIWDEVCTTDPDHTKKVDFGRKFTSIDSQYQIEKATKIFGPVGEGWGYSAEHSTLEVGKIVLAFCDIMLWQGTRERSYGPVRGCNALINSNGRLDDDAPKKALTDALTKALSHLGFNADVFLGKFDDNKYIERLKGEKTGPVVDEYLDPIRKAVVDNDELAGMQLIRELREVNQDAWIILWGMLDMQEKKVVRAWGKPGEASS